MDENQSLRLANRQMIGERQALLAQRDQLQQELTQRHVDAATSTIRGIETLAALAATGNPAARLALKTLLDALEAARTALVGIVVVKS